MRTCSFNSLVQRYPIEYLLNLPPNSLVQHLAKALVGQMHPSRRMPLIKTVILGILVHLGSSLFMWWWWLWWWLDTFNLKHYIQNPRHRSYIPGNPEFPTKMIPGLVFSRSNWSNDQNSSKGNERKDLSDGQYIPPFFFGLYLAFSSLHNMWR